MANAAACTELPSKALRCLSRSERPLLRHTLIPCAAIVGCSMSDACADAPPFDRPGIAFSTGTFPAGTFAWEQGFPDFASSSQDGVDMRVYSADSRLRVGLTDSVEVQIASALFNRMKTHESGNTDTSDGRGDTSFALKVALPSRQQFSWAALGAVTVSDGADQFTNGGTAYDFGVAFGYAMSDAASGEVYVNVNRLDGSTSYDISPNCNFALSQSVNGFVEMGATYTNHGLDQAVAGGGFTWMVTPSVQLDLSADFGLTNKSPDVLAGFGISVFFNP
jgi:hypothetical protein